MRAKSALRDVTAAGLLPAAKWAVTKRNDVEKRSKLIATPALFAITRPNPVHYYVRCKLLCTL